MKNTIKYFLILALPLFISCDHPENEIVPEFLDGTEYGVLLDVDVTSALEIAVADMSDYTLNFSVKHTGAEKRAVTNIVVQKIHVDIANGASTAIEEVTITDFPEAVSISASELVAGFPDLSLEDIEAGDAFLLNFIINYQDGGVVASYDSSMRTNFQLTITN